MKEHSANIQRQLIIDTFADSQYIKNATRPFSGIFNILRNWFFCYFALLLFNDVFTSFAVNTVFSSFYIIPRFTYSIGYLFILLFYCFLCKYTKTTVMERDFLKMYFIVPVTMCGQYIVWVLTFMFLPDLYLFLTLFPLGGVIGCLLSSILFCHYFRDKKLALAVLVNLIILICCFGVVACTSFSRNVYLIELLSPLRCLIDDFLKFGTFEFVYFLTVAIFLHEKKKEKEHEYIDI